MIQTSGHRDSGAVTGIRTEPSSSWPQRFTPERAFCIPTLGQWRRTGATSTECVRGAVATDRGIATWICPRAPRLSKALRTHTTKLARLIGRCTER